MLGNGGRSSASAMVVGSLLSLLLAQGARAAFCSVLDPSQPASSTVYSYTFPSAQGGYWLDASFDPTVWTKPFLSGEEILRFTGSGCYWYGGGIDGPIPNNAVYECVDAECPAGSSQHCAGGSDGVCAVCPVPCIDWKIETGNLPSFRWSASTVMIGPLVRDNAMILPTPSRTLACSGNSILFRDTATSPNALAWLADTDGDGSGLTNQGKLDALNALFPGCVTVRFNATGVDVFWDLWLPLWQGWKDSHQAGQPGACVG